MHKYKINALIMSMIFLTSLCFVFSTSENVKAQGREIYVDSSYVYPEESDGSLYNPYSFIQHAIEAAEDGDIIKVIPGEYTEDIVVDKSVTITTGGRNHTFLNSSAKVNYIIDITAPDVSIEGFSIRDYTSTSHRKALIHISSDATNVKIIGNLFNHSKNGYAVMVDRGNSGIIKNNVVNDTRGIYIENSNVITIDENEIHNSTTTAGVKIYQSSGNYITNNKIDNCTFGIYGTSCSDTVIDNNTVNYSYNSGIVIASGSGNEITDNTIEHNSNNGMDIACDDGIIQNNTLHKNDLNINLAGSGNEIFENYISSATTIGIYAIYGSRSNVIYNNTFRKNTKSNAQDEGNNQWDNGSVGNNWDDFYGPDPAHENNTTPYNPNNVPNVYKYIENGVVDRYPTGKYNTQPWIKDPWPKNLAENVEKSPRLYVIVNDTDPEPYKGRLDVYWYYILEGDEYLIGSKENVDPGTNVSIGFYSFMEGRPTVYSYKGLGYGYIGVWKIVVKDSYSQNSSPMWIFSTINNPVGNQRPMIEIDAQHFLQDNVIEAQKGDEIQFNASGSNDTDGEILFYRWDFGDGNSIINQVAPAHTYEEEGEYTLNLVLIDDDGASNTTDIPVFIGGYNKPPIAKHSGPYNGKAGDLIYFDGSGCIDPNQDEMEFIWDFGDGATSDQQSPTHEYAAARNYTVTLTVSDGINTNKTTTYALISEKKDNGSPGFEMLFVLLAIMSLLVFDRKRKKTR